MLYWVIPYLLAYNTSDPEILKYGPEHVFKTEVHIQVVYNALDNPFESSWNVTIETACRPINEKLIQCRLESAYENDYEILNNNTNRIVGDQVPREFGIDNIVFQVEFDYNGISRVWFLNNRKPLYQNMIRSIINSVNLGFNNKNVKKIAWGETVPGKIFEKSIIGMCETTFKFRKTLKDQERENLIDEFEFYYPWELSNDDQIVIEKKRKLNKCFKKTSYFFGSDDMVKRTRKKDDLKTELDIESSRSQFNMDKHSFTAFTENFGTIVFSNSTLRREIKLTEVTRVRLESIRAAKTQLLNTGDLANVGSGFQPGTPWPPNWL